jgi:hypothetical protein
LLLFTRSQQQAKIHENRLRRWDFCSLAQFNLRSAQQVRRPMRTVTVFFRRGKVCEVWAFHLGKIDYNRERSCCR